MNLSLVVAEGVRAGMALRVGKFPFMIGRAASCGLRAASAMVSSQHCVLLLRAGKVYVHDYNSTNGTFVNDQRITSVTEIRDGDLFRVGPLAFTVALTGSVSPDQPTPLPLGRETGVATSDEDEMGSLLLGMDEGEGTVADKDPKTILIDRPITPEAAPHVSRPARSASPASSTVDAAHKLLQEMARRRRK